MKVVLALFEEDESEAAELLRKDFSEAKGEFHASLTAYRELGMRRVSRPSVK